MLQAFAEAFGCTAELFVIDDQQTPLLGLALFVQQRLGMQAVVRLPTLAYTPMALTPEGDRKLSTTPHALAESFQALAEAYGQVQLTLPPWFSDVRPFTWANWHAKPLYTALVDLANPNLLQNWSASARRTIRKSTDAYRVKLSSSTPHALMPLYAGSYERQQREIPASQATLQTLVGQLCQTSYCTLPVAYSIADDHPAAAIALLQNHQSAHYWLAGSQPGPSMSVLLHAWWQDAQSRGLHTFDFIGANTPSIAEFKRRLGGRLVPYYHVAAYSHPLLRWRHRLTR